jgi:BON domain
MKTRASAHLSALALLTIFAVTVGCAKTPNDAQISSDIQNKLNADSGLQGKQLGVQAAAGTVTLSGSVDNETERDAAARYAASVPGVKQVVNNIQIAAPAPEQTAQAQAPPEQPTAAEAPKPSPSHHRSHHRSRASASSDAQEAQPSDTQEAEAAPPASNLPPVAPPPAEMSQPAEPPPAKKVTIPAGTTLAVRLVDPIDSETAQQGQTFHATLDSPLSVDGEVAIPAGYDVEGHVVAVQSAGKFAGKSLLTLQLDRLSVAGKRYNLQTDQFHREGASRGKGTAEKVGAGAVLGGIIGAIAGGGKGAAIGAAAGGGVGGGVQATSKSQQIKLDSEAVLNFTLQQPVTVTETQKGPHGNAEKLSVNE